MKSGAPNRPSRVAVVQDPEKPVDREILAEAIVRMSEAVKKLSAVSGLNRRALIVLIEDSIPSPLPGRGRIGKTDIAAVLDAMEQLKARYCR